MIVVSYGHDIPGSAKKGILTPAASSKRPGQARFQREQVKVRVFYFKRGQEVSMKYMVEGKTPTAEDFKTDYAQVQALKIKPDTDAAKDDIVLAERMFAMFNSDTVNPLGTPGGQQIIRSLDVGHTSMSMGDIVVIGETPFIVRGEGFEKLPFSVTPLQGL